MSAPHETERNEQRAQTSVLVHRSEPRDGSSSEGPSSSRDGAAAGGGGQPAEAHRPMQLRSLLSQLGSSFTRPSDDFRQVQPTRLQFSITSSGPPDAPQVPVLTSPRQQQQQAEQAAGQAPSPGQQPAAAAGGDNGEEALQAALADVENVAAAAERHRLLASSVDIRAAAMAIEKALPFVLLLLVCFVYQHLLGLSLFGWLTWVLSRLNAVLRAQVALKQDLQPQQLYAAAGAVAAQLPIIALANRRRSVADLLLLRGAPTLDFWSALFLVAVADLVARFAAVLAKIGILLAAKVDTPPRFRRRGAWITAVEYTASLYRSFLPAGVWYRYFRAATTGGAFSLALSAAYIILKVGNIYERAALAGLALRQAALGGSTYGSAATPEEVAEAGGECPICQHELRSPVKLPCSHIFCADCLSEWTERDQGSTCPMCRAVIRTSRLRPCSDASTTLLPQVF